MPVPATGAYLGAWIHPVSPGATSSSFATEQEYLTSVQRATIHHLGILHVYSSFRKPAPISSLTAISSNGSIPMIDWGCTSAGAVTSGADDATITAFAQALRSYAKPVLLRECWEMNFPKTHSQLFDATQFVASWRHIWTIFRQVGVPNVSFVWCPGVSGTDPAPFYPGDRYVDWIGVDGYDRTGTSTFSSLFSGFYQTWSTHGKPMVVCETGSMGANQAAYIGSIGTDAPTMPDFKAVVYFDGVGPAGSWVLTGAGLTAFGALARNPYFAH